MPERVTGPAFYFPSIEKKYGKPISYWLDLIGSSELTKHKELVDWLKAGYGIGHGHATALVGTPSPSAPRARARTLARTLARTREGLIRHEEDHRRDVHHARRRGGSAGEVEPAVLRRRAEPGRDARIAASASAHLYGRRSYELLRGVFTGPAAPPHAPLMTNTPKIVVSSTLDNADWGPTTVISGGVERHPGQAEGAAGQGRHGRGERHPRAVPAARAPAR